MKDIWFISDTHFFHGNILTFTGNDGKLIRPKFTTANEMNSYMVAKWNATIKPGDKVYHLGDVAMGFKAGCGDLIKSLHGRKRLIVGNHDEVKELAPYFEKVLLWRIFKEFDFVCSHIPLRLDQLRKVAFNVHGHIHQNKMKEPQYINVCVEHHDYTPLHLDEICNIIKKRKRLMGDENASLVP